MNATELSPLKRALLAIEELQAKLDTVEKQRYEPLAIIGVGCRIPGGANDPEEFWRLLHEGRSGVREIASDRWDAEAFYDPNPDAPGKIATRFGGFLDQVDRFEPQFFEISPREALTMDPQQRLLLEVSWEALEQAGQSPVRLAHTRTGVFIGVCSSDYAQLLLEAGNPALMDMYYASGIAHSIASGRLSYVLGLQGPSISVDTACSSSLVAVHLACQSLRNRECRLALAGGVNVILSPQVFSALSRARMLAADGKCKTFDAAADGFVRGEGCGVIVLKRLEDALSDGDRILALIRGSAVNQDGPSSGLTAPNGPSQESVIQDALANAAVSPHDVSYIEAHGTGTSLGDPIEVQALAAVFGPGREAATPLLIGSLKTNVGHLEAAAGVSGLIKVVLSLQHREIPQHLHFRQPSPHIAWDRLAVRVTSEREPWTPLHGKRIAGVSSFGFSGTNAHVVLEEAPMVLPKTSNKERPLHLLTLSARTEPALATLIERYAQRLEVGEQMVPADLCHTANVGRAHLAHRLALTAADAESMAEKLRESRSGNPSSSVVRAYSEGTERQKIAFLFTGQGSQYLGMGRRLYETSPTFACALNRCDIALRDRLDCSLLDVLYPRDGASPQLDETRFTQPALFAVEYALSELWRSWGVQPTFVLGHSVGEYVAACVAGVFSVQDGLALTAERGRLMQAQPSGGRMAAIMAPIEIVQEMLKPLRDRVSIAALNGPRQTVISGAGCEVQALLDRFSAAGIKFRELGVSHAFHSPLMNPVLEPFEQAAAKVSFGAPRLRLVSNLTGEVASAAQICQPSYWREQIRETVQYAVSMQTLADNGCKVFLEIGPNPVLLGLGRECIDLEGTLWLSSLRSGRDDWTELLASLSQLYVHGVDVDWAGFDRDYPRHKVSLPTYPFQRERYFVDREIQRTGRPEIAQALHPSAHLADCATLESDIQTSIDQWLYEIAWIPLDESGAPGDEHSGASERPRTATARRWLILADRGGKGQQLGEHLTRHGDQCVLAFADDGTNGSPNEGEMLDPGSPEDLEKFISRQTTGTERPIHGIIYLWPLDAAPLDKLDETTVERELELWCGGALHLVQAIARHAGSQPSRLWLCTRGAQKVAEADRALSPIAATVWGLGKTIALEYPELRCVRLDLAPNIAANEIEFVIAALSAEDNEDQVALRAGRRWGARLQRIKKPSDSADLLLRQRTGGFNVDSKGTYLITGGLRGVGLMTAQWLVEHGARYLVLTGRRAPEHEAGEVLRALEARGIHVRVAQANVSDAGTMKRLLEETRNTMPPLRGVIHSAGVLDDGVLLQQSWDRFATVFAPKVTGSLLLHRLTASDPLDFFVLFSSVAAVFGSPGQGNYVAANAFMDTLAAARAAEGVRGLSINWGAWAGAGVAVDRGVTARARETGYGVIDPQGGFQALEAALSGGQSQVIIFPEDWPRFLAHFSRGGYFPTFLTNLAGPDLTPRPASWHRLDGEATMGGPVSGASRNAASFEDRLAALAPNQRRGLVIDQVRRDAARVLGIENLELLPNNKPLNELGLDSLMAVDLRNGLANALGRNLPATLLFDYPTVEVLAGYLSRRVLGLDEASTGPVRSSSLSEGSDVLDQIEDLDEDEIDRLLKERGVQ